MRPSSICFVLQSRICSCTVLRFQLNTVRTSQDNCNKKENRAFQCRIGRDHIRPEKTTTNRAIYIWTHQHTLSTFAFCRYPRNEKNQMNKIPQDWLYIIRNIFHDLCCVNNCTIANKIIVSYKGN